MAEGGSVVHYSLVHVRGGATMLLTALFGSLPPLAQVALRRLLLLFPVVSLAKMQRVAAQEFAKRALLPLLTGVLPSSVADACTSVKLPRSSAALLSTLSSAILLYSAGLKLVEADQRACAAFTPATLASLPSEEELLCRLIGAVVEAEAARLPPAQRSAIASAPAAPPRVLDTFFSTTTPVALKAYLRHMQANACTSALTVYVPGLLTAPWTTHLVPLLCDAAACRHGMTVVGYDVELCDTRYSVDFDHLCRVSRARRHGERSRSGKGNNAKEVVHGTLSPDATSAAAQTASPTTAVLVLASIRGRRVRNADKVCGWAKMHGWAVVELCVPTLPSAALDALAPPPHKPQWMRSWQTRSGDAALVRPDLRVTAFDDAGMYGGAVVEVCTTDASLRLHMQRDCQPGLSESRGGVTVARGNTASVPRTVRSLAPAAVASTMDALGRSNDFLATVWGPWTQRLFVAAWREADVLHQGSVLAQEAWTALRRFPTQTLPRLPAHATAQLHRLASLRLFQGDGGAGDGSAGGDAVPTDSADAPLEQRTTYITGPLAPLASSSLPPAVPQPAVRETDKSAAAATRETAVAAARAAFPPVPEQALTNSPVEWRIRLRWSSLLLSPALASEGRLDLSPSPTAAATAAYLSVWSFVAQLPPWVVAVSVASEDGLGNGTIKPHGLPWSDACVEASATALLVRVAFPASPRAAAELLLEEAHVEAAAVRPRLWASPTAATGAPATPSTRPASVAFEDVVIFPGCEQAARLGEELLYLPLSPELPVHVRATMLRVLWDKVPHPEKAAHAGPAQGTTTPASVPPHVQATLSHIYRTNLPRAQRTGDDKDGGVRALGVGGDVAVTRQDAERVQQYFFNSAAAGGSASSPAPLAAVRSLAQTLLLSTMSSL